jgi:C1A family cysteine protease
MNRIYNYKFQNIDNRDYLFTPLTHSTNDESTFLTSNENNIKLKLPTSHFITDYSKHQSPILNQESLGSCVANAVKSMMYIISSGKVDLSRLHLYLCYRNIDGSSLCEDAGGTIRSAMKAIKEYGVCEESLWSYNISNFARLPPSKAFTSTYKLNNFVYTSIRQDINDIKTSLHMNLPVILGIMIYSSIDSLITQKYGVIQIPDFEKEKILGAHCIILVGYDDNSSYFKFQNSWGEQWGDKGFGYIPYNYILNNNLTSDIWNMYFTLQ